MLGPRRWGWGLGGGHGESSLGELHGWGLQEEAGRGRGCAGTQLWTWRPSGGRGEGTVGGRSWGCFDDGDEPVSCPARRSRWVGWCPKSLLAVDPAPSLRSRRSLKGSAGPCLAPHLGDPGAWAFTLQASAAPYILCGPTCFCQHPRCPQPWVRAGPGPRVAGASGRPSPNSVWLFTGPWGLPLEPGATGLLSGQGGAGCQSNIVRGNRAAENRPAGLCWGPSVAPPAPEPWEQSTEVSHCFRHRELPQRGMGTRELLIKPRWSQREGWPAAWTSGQCYTLWAKRTRNLKVQPAPHPGSCRWLHKVTGKGLRDTIQLSAAGFHLGSGSFRGKVHPGILNPSSRTANGPGGSLCLRDDTSHPRTLSCPTLPHMAVPPPGSFPCSGLTLQTPRASPEWGGCASSTRPAEPGPGLCLVREKPLRPQPGAPRSSLWALDTAPHFLRVAGGGPERGQLPAHLHSGCPPSSRSEAGVLPLGGSSTP